MGDVPNASATVIGNGPVIVYNPGFLDAWFNRNHPAGMTVLAHEVGNHANMDTTWYAQNKHSLVRNWARTVPRCLVLFLISWLLFSTDSACASTDERIAIVDVAFDTRPFIDRLANSGIKVVGRYLARCRQWPGKRLVDQGYANDRNGEVEQLQAAGFGILSIYQYNSNSEKKFIGLDKDGRALPGADCKGSAVERSPSDEAKLDAEAAVEQAALLGQPRGSAIYFGVDFPIEARDRLTIDRMVEYFRVLKATIGSAGFLIGAYGSGLAHEILRREGLASLFWISASRAFEGTTRFHNSSEWHLFQNSVDREWYSLAPACKSGLILDANVQNARLAQAYIGFWRRHGEFRVDANRTKAIMSARRFICTGASALFKNAILEERSNGSVCHNGKLASKSAQITFSDSVRIGDVSSSGRIQVDIDDDGRFDGWVPRRDLTLDYYSKPAWIFDKRNRAAAKCSQ